MTKKKIFFIQRVVADYRLPLFDSISEWADIKVFYGDPRDSTDIRPIFEKRDYLCKCFVTYMGKLFWHHKGVLDDIKHNSPDFIIISPTPRSLSYYHIYLYCKIKGIPLLGWGMGEMPGRGFFLSIFHRLVQKSVVFGLKAIICYSSKSKDYYKSLGFKGNLHVAKNAINLEILKESVVNFNQSKKDKILRILFIGRLIPDKKIEALIKIVLEIDNFELTIAGGGDFAYQSGIIDACTNNLNKIKFLGHVELSDLPRVCSQNDVFVLPARGGLAINHAMACGLPVICSEGDGTEEDLVIEGVTGYRFSNDNWQQLKDILINISVSKDNLKVIGNNAKKHVENNFTIEAMSSVFKCAIEDCNK